MLGGWVGSMIFASKSRACGVQFYPQWVLIDGGVTGYGPKKSILGEIPTYACVANYRIPRVYQTSAERARAFVN